MLNTLTATLLTLAIALPLGVGTGYSLDGVTYMRPRRFPPSPTPSWASSRRTLPQRGPATQLLPIIVFAIVVAGVQRLASSARMARSTFLAVQGVHRRRQQGPGRDRKLGCWVHAVRRGGAHWRVVLPASPTRAAAWRAGRCLRGPGQSRFFGVGVCIRSLGGGHASPVRFLKGMAPAAVTAFTTQSSIGTLPVTIRSLTQNLGVSEDVASFTPALAQTRHASLRRYVALRSWRSSSTRWASPFTPVQYGFLVLLPRLSSPLAPWACPARRCITATALLAAGASRGDHRPRRPSPPSWTWAARQPT